jgi:hypothetical protein
MIHRLHNRRNLRQALNGAMEALLFHANDTCELLEIITLRGSQWIRFEERNDAISQINGRPDVIPIQVLPVIIVSTIDIDTTASEELPQLMQDNLAPFSLNHGESGLNLPTYAIGSISKDRYAEAAFTVDEADDPLLDSWPFLLIARTRRIVTAHVCTVPRGTDTIGTAGCSGIPANSQLHSRRHRREGQQSEAVTCLRSP